MGNQRAEKFGWRFHSWRRVAARHRPVACSTHNYARRNVGIRPECRRDCPISSKSKSMKTHLKSFLGAVLIGSLLVLVGCVVTSVYPYYTAKDVVKNPALAGQWAEVGETNVAAKHWQFEAGDGQGYWLFVGDEQTEYLAHLFQLKGKRFIDAKPTREGGHFIPPHYLLRVTRLDESNLELSLMDYEWLKTLVKEKPKAIRHVWVADSGDDTRLVLTANTAELQAFVLKYLANTNAFKPAFAMRRQ